MSEEEKMSKLLEKQRKIVDEFRNPQSLDNKSWFEKNVKAFTENLNDIKKELGSYSLKEKEDFFLKNIDLFYFDDGHLYHEHLVKNGVNSLMLMDFSNEEKAKESAQIIVKSIDKFLVNKVKNWEPRSFVDYAADIIFPFATQLSDLFKKLEQDKVDILCEELLGKSAPLMMGLADNFGERDIIEKNLDFINHLNRASLRVFNQPLADYLLTKIGSNLANTGLGIRKFIGGNDKNFSVSINNRGYEYEENGPFICKETDYKRLTGATDMDNYRIKLLLTICEDGALRKAQKEILNGFLSDCLPMYSPNAISSLLETDYFPNRFSKQNVELIKDFFEDIEYEDLPHKRLVDDIKHGDVTKFYSVDGYSPILSGYEAINKETHGAKLFEGVSKVWPDVLKRYFDGETLKDWGIDNAALKQHGLPTIEEYFLSHPLPRLEENKQALNGLLGDAMYNKLLSKKLNETDSLSLLKAIKERGANYFQTILARNFSDDACKTGLQKYHEDHLVATNNVGLRMLCQEKTSDVYVNLDFSSPKVIKELKKHFVSEQEGVSAINRFWTSLLCSSIMNVPKVKPNLDINFEMLQNVILPCTQETIKNNPYIQGLFGIDDASKCTTAQIKEAIKNKLMEGVERFYGNGISEFAYHFSKNELENSKLGKRMSVLPL